MKKYKVLKIISLVLIILITAFLLYGLINVLTVTDPDNRQMSLAFYLALFVIITGIPSYALTAVVSCIGLVLSAVALKKKETTKGTLIYFIILTALPIIFETLFLVICYAI